MLQARCEAAGTSLREPHCSGARSCHRTSGFTLVELLITVIILGILASLAIKAINAREQAYIATMKSDLKNVILSQYNYFDEHMEYAPAMPLQNFEPSPGVNVLIAGDASKGFTARAQHANATARCAVFIGEIFPIFQPATKEGVIACSPSGQGSGGASGKGKGP